MLTEKIPIESFKEILAVFQKALCSITMDTILKEYFHEPRKNSKIHQIHIK